MPPIRNLGLVAALILAFALPETVLGVEPPFPAPVAHYATISRDGPQRPWRLPFAVAANLAVAAYADPIAPPGPYPLPNEPKKGEGDDPAFWNLRSGLLALAENDLDKALYEFSEGARRGAGIESADACQFWLGEARVRKGKFSEASVAYDKVTGALRSEARYRLARITQNDGRPEAARKVWSELAADSVSPHRTEAYYRLGVFEAAEGSLGEAQINFANALSGSDPGSDVAVGAAFEAARLNRDGGNLAEAERLLLSLLLTRPDHPLADGARVLLGWVEGDAGNFSGAARRIEPLLNLPNLPEGFAVRARYQLARSAAAAGDHALARKYSGELLMVSDGPWAGWSSADYAYSLYTAGDFEGALGAYLEAEKLWRGEGAGEIPFSSGECLFRLGRFDEAADHFAKVAPTSSAAPYALHRGAEALAKAGKRGEALKLLEKLLSGRGDYAGMAGVRALAGNLYFAEGRNREALAALSQVAENEPGGELLNYLKGWQAFSEGGYRDAVPYLEKHLASGPAAPKRGLAASMLGKAEYELGDIDRAAAAMRLASAAAETPEDAESARYDAGWMLISAGRDEEGAVELEKLVADYPTGAMNAKARYALGQSKALAGKFDEALIRFGEIEKVSGNSELAQLAVKGKIEALNALGRNGEALAECRKLGDDPEGLGCSVAALLRLGRTDEALLELDRFSASHPADPALPELETAATKALLTAGRKAEAIERLAVVGARPGGAKRGEALLERAELLAGEGRNEEALAQYSSLAATGEDITVVVYSTRRAAALEASLGRRAEAAARLEGALKASALADESAHQLLNDLAELLIDSGDYPTALEKARRASTMGDGDEGLRTDVLISTALEKSGNPNAALETLLRIGYHYDLGKPAAAEAAQHAATLLEKAGRLDEAGELRARLSAAKAEAGAESSDPAKSE